jgi:hypothetical protein
VIVTRIEDLDAAMTAGAVFQLSSPDWLYYLTAVDECAGDCPCIQQLGVPCAGAGDLRHIDFDTYVEVHFEADRPLPIVGYLT